MKILVVGDFHGKFPKRLQLKITKERPELIISVGDYPNSNKLRELEFKYWEDLKCRGNNLEKIIGVKLFNKLMREDLKSLREIIKKIISFKISIITIAGNSDPLNKNVKKYGLRGVESLCKSAGIKLLKTNTKKVNDWTIAGFSGYRGATSKGLVDTTLNEKKIIKSLNKKWDYRLKRLFNKIRDFDRTIFVIHDMPKGYFDLVKSKKSPLYGKRVGDEYFIKYIKQYHPAIVVGGHMHEYQGMKKVGKTLVVTTGAAKDGKAVMLDIPPNKKEKINVHFIK